MTGTAPQHRQGHGVALLTRESMLLTYVERAVEPTNENSSAYAAGYLFGQLFFLTVGIFVGALFVRAVRRQSRKGPVPLRSGMPVLVQWADGNRYPGAVEQAGHGQYLVALADGRRIWVARAYLTTIDAKDERSGAATSRRDPSGNG